MGHVVKDTTWCVIDIDTATGHVFLQQRWKYSWVVLPPMAPWTQTEQHDFHTRADRNIWAAWSNRARLNVQGSSAFARSFAGRGVTINLDIRWVTARNHWMVTVPKTPPGTFRTSSVTWTARPISLATTDFVTRSICHSGNQLRSRHFRTIIDEMNSMIPGTIFSVRRV